MAGHLEEIDANLKALPVEFQKPCKKVGYLQVQPEGFESAPRPTPS